MILVFILHPVCVEHRFSLPMNLLWWILLSHVIAVAGWLLLCFIRVTPWIDVRNIGNLRSRIVVRGVTQIRLDILNIVHYHLVWLVIHHALKLALVLLCLLVVVWVRTRVHMLPLLVEISQLLLQLLVILAGSLSTLRLLLAQLIWCLSLGTWRHVTVFDAFWGRNFICYNLWLRCVAVLFGILLRSMSRLWRMWLIFGF